MFEYMCMHLFLKTKCILKYKCMHVNARGYGKSFFLVLTRHKRNNIIFYGIYLGILRILITLLHFFQHNRLTD